MMSHIDPITTTRAHRTAPVRPAPMNKILIRFIFTLSLLAMALAHIGTAYAAPPNAVTDFAMTPLDNYDARLTWTPSAGATNNQLEYTTHVGGTFGFLQRSVNNPAIFDGTAILNGLIRYRLKVCNADNECSTSNVVSTKLGNFADAPMVTVTREGALVTLNWTTPGGTDVLPFTGYIIEIFTAPGTTPRRFAVGLINQRSVTNVDAVAELTFTVAANHLGGSGAKGSASLLPPLPPPPTPTNFEIEPRNDYGAEFTWSLSAGATYYQLIYRIAGSISRTFNLVTDTQYTNSPGIYDGSASSFLTGDVNFRLRACNDGPDGIRGNSDDGCSQSSFKQIRLASNPPLPSPATPANLRSTSQTDTTITLAWDASARADSYVITYRVAGSTPLDPPVLTTTRTSETISRLTANTEYEITVAARNRNSGNSAASAVVTVSTLTAAKIADFTRDDRVDINDAALFYYAFALSAALGNGTPGSGHETLRATVLGPLLPTNTGDGRILNILRAIDTLTQTVPTELNIINDSDIDIKDARAFYYAIQLRDELSDDTPGSSSKALREAILGPLLQSPDDAALRGVLTKANRLLP